MTQDWFDALPIEGKKEKKKDWFDSLPIESVVGQEEKDWFFQLPVTEVVGQDIELMPSHGSPKKPPMPLALGAAEGIRSGYESVIGPMEGALETGTDIFNFLSSIAVTIGASAPWGEGDWERGAEIGGKYSQFIENLYDPKTDFGKQSVAPIDAFFDKVGEAMLYTGEDVFELGGDDLVKFETAVGIGFIALGSRLHGKKKAAFKKVVSKAKTLRPLKTILKRSKEIPREVKTVIDKIPDEMPIKPEIQEVMKESKPVGPAGVKPIPEFPEQRMPKIPQPEAGGQAYGQELPTKVGNIRIDKLDSSYDIKKALVDVAATYKSKGMVQKRGKISWKETEKLANDLGMTVEQLQKTRKGKAFNAEELEASRTILGGTVEDLFKKQSKFRADPSDANLIAATAALDRAGLVSTAVTGAKGEAGRALGILRKEYHPGELKFEAMERILRELGGREKNQEIIARMMSLDWDNPMEINKFVREVTKVKFSDKAFELWVNNLLSGLPTHIVNSVSTAAMAAEKPIVTGIAAAIEVPKRLVGKEPKVYFGEVPAEIFSIKSGLRSGVGKASFAFANEMTMGGATKMEVRVPTAIKGKKGEVARLPGRFLMTEDEFFKAIIYEADIHGHAYNKATKAGLRGAERNRRIAELIKEPTEDMMIRATGEMLARSFQKPLGKYGKKIQSIVQGIPGLRYIVPFLRVSLNIPKEAFRRTPLNIPRIIVKAAKGELKGAELSREMAMAGMGTLASIAVFDMAMDGLITGGAPEDQSEKAAFYREGKQPYSVKVGDKWFSYARVEPLATIIGIAADATDVWKYATEEEKDKLASKMIGMVTENVTNKTFMRGVSTIMRAFSDPERWGDYAVESLTGTVVPTGVSYAAKALDPVMRDAKGIIDNIKSRIPELSKTLEAQVDIWGREKTREGGALFQMISPVWMSTEKATPVDNELQRLGVYIGAISKRLGDRKLEKDEYEEMAKDIGEDLYKTLYQVTSSPSYRAVTDDEAKIRIVRAIVSAIRKKGRDKYRDIEIVIE